MVLKTVVHNGTGGEVEIKESQGGVLRKMLPSLEKDGKTTMKIYESATYKVFWFTVQSDNATVALTSNDCNDWKEVRIVREDATLTWKGVEGKSRNNAQPKSGTTGAGNPQPKTDTSGAGVPPTPSNQSAAPLVPSEADRGEKNSNDSKVPGTSAAPPNEAAISPSDQGSNLPEESQVT